MCIRDRRGEVPGGRHQLVGLLRLHPGEQLPDLFREAASVAVSYTHLDVYKRQGYERGRRPPEKRFRPGQMYRAARTQPSKFRQRQYRLVVEHRQLQAAT